MAPVSSTTRPDPETRCTCAIPGQSEARQIFSAPSGLHGHFLLWSPDRAFIYFVQGSPPDHLDIWRIRPTGGTSERLTHHDSVVTHPVFMNARTLLYLATDANGAGPWIYGLDVEDRTTRRISSGVDSYTSLAASADGRRIVATMASPKGTLWRVPWNGRKAEMSAAHRIALTTGNGSLPRLGPDYLLYVSSKGASDSLWKLQGGTATELWSAPETRIIGAPAVRRDGRRIAFSVDQRGQTTLYVVSPDGTDARVVTSALKLRGAPAWTPDGVAITVASVVDDLPRLFKVPLDGRSPTPFVAEHSVDPVWSPDGDIVAFSGADVGTMFPVQGGAGRRQRLSHGLPQAHTRRTTSVVHAGRAVPRDAARRDWPQESLGRRSGHRLRASGERLRSRLRREGLRRLSGRSRDRAAASPGAFGHRADRVASALTNAAGRRAPSCRPHSGRFGSLV